MSNKGLEAMLSREGLTEEEAIKRRDELNLKEFGTTTPSYDHYGVMEMSTKHRGHEIKCPATFGRS